FMKINPNQPGQHCPGHNRNRIESVAVADLSFRPGDPKRFSKREIELAEAVQEKLPEGAPLPIIVNDRGQVLAGHIFVEAAQKLGIERIMVIRHEGMSELEEKSYAIAINQLLARGSWDPTDL